MLSFVTLLPVRAYLTLETLLQTTAGRTLFDWTKKEKICFATVTVGRFRCQFKFNAVLNAEHKICCKMQFYH